MLGPAPRACVKARTSVALTVVEKTSPKVGAWPPIADTALKGSKINLEEQLGSPKRSLTFTSL
ncbi:hypothetical protein FRC11_011300, partial [Ceratobasidium sp. 423]